MKTTTHRKLTPGEQRYLEHARRAKAQGVSLAQYCRATGVSAQSLYNAKRELTRKGTLGQPGPKTPKPEEPGEFIAVRVAGSPTPRTDAVCRLRHPSGWVIECASWPPALWLAECLSGGAHAAT